MSWKLLVTVLFPVVLILSGCMGVAHDIDKKGFPTYEETLGKWPRIKEGYGRIVFYFPRTSSADSFAIIGVGGELTQKIRIGEHKFWMKDEYFRFIELKPGLHTIELIGGLVVPGKKLKVSLAADQTLYIKIYRTSSRIDQPKLMDPIEAQEELKSQEIRHSSVKILPYNEAK